MARAYRMKTRAAAREETRERIVRATMALHDEQGIASTTFADVAERAGVGAATVLRHFPSVGDLVSACGQHVAAEMRPPMPDHADAAFAGLTTTRSRIARLVAELDAFYGRGETRLIAAANDRARIPELGRFLDMVEAGIDAWIRTALVDENPDDTTVAVLMALCSITVWQGMKQSGLTDQDRQDVLTAVLECALGFVRSETGPRDGVV
ncbi:MAG: TetR/AcrR family transcriptional regulator [Rhodobacteraceae bacterium]|nr:TetR/AcrR family transcriptional regulator [Paracoccaceae bacterium]